jgi:hypothetical protein
MDDRTRILTQILADTDAVWLPNRRWSRPRPTNVHFARLAFGKGGVPWESGEPTEAGRKAAQRELEELAKARLVRASRLRRVKTLAVRLSEPADADMRERIGLAGLYSAWLSMHEIARHSRRPPELFTDVYIAERKLIGDKPPETYRREAVIVEDMLLPALVRGYVDSNADTQGRVSYMLTPAGWEWLDRGEAPPEDLRDDAPLGRDAATWYAERLQTSLDRLGTADAAEPREIGLLPLPVAVQGLTVSGPWIPAATS